MSTPKIKITYFNIEGAAEKARLALTLAKVPFEDERVNFPDWAALKPKTPHGSLPILDLDGEVFTDSAAIMRYCASLDSTKTLMPADPKQQLKIESAIGLCGDIERAWSPALYMGMRPQMFGYPEDFSKTPEGQAKVKEMRQKFVADEMPKWMGFITAMMEKNGGPFLCGDKPTLADCYFLPILRSFCKGHVDHVDVTWIEAFPKMVEYKKKMEAIPELAAKYAAA
mmetsp:Transcript_5782/g.9174  ORF Transcript_5782/g.9174 Transcript_5782/m.9174 type:complete len:226 (+) Transcript_5782:114-791(+)